MSRIPVQACASLPSNEQIAAAVMSVFLIWFFIGWLWCNAYLDLEGEDADFEQEQTEISVSVSIPSAFSCRTPGGHRFAPGRIRRCTPSVSFISWKLMSNPIGISSSFM